MSKKSTSRLTRYSKSDTIEVRTLKQLLENVSCKCKTCHNASENRLSNVKRLKHAEVQAECRSPTDCHAIYTEKGFKINCNRKHSFCPTCFLTMNVLRGDSVKILKDEKSETKAVFRCDKSVGRRVKYLHKSTSISRFALRSISEYSSSSDSVTVTYRSHSRRSRSGLEDRIKLSDLLLEVPEHNDNNVKEPPNSNRVYLENFINSIRPPIVSSELFGY